MAHSGGSHAKNLGTYSTCILTYLFQSPSSIHSASSSPPESIPSLLNFCLSFLHCLLIHYFLLFHLSFQHKGQFSKVQVWSCHNLYISEMTLRCLHKLIPAQLTSHPCSSPIPYFSNHPHQFSVPYALYFLTLNALAIHPPCVRSSLPFLAN